MSLLYRMGTGNGSGGDLKPFIVNFTCDSGFIGKTVTMEFQGTPHAGETVDNVSGTVASDGTLTLYPMHDGLWKYYATSDVTGYHEGTITLEKWGNYPVELKDIPNGATFTPTDDVQTWLHCAIIWDKSYTTISEVVADTTTFNALLNNSNANDYLVRSTTFATTLCQNTTSNTSMYYLGLYDDCANKLLNDTTWNNAIKNANVKLADGTYLFEKILNAKNPYMTGNDSTVAYANTVFSGDYDIYMAFDNNDSSSWSGSISVNSQNAYLQYTFKKKIKLNILSYLDLTSPQNKIEGALHGVRDDGTETKLVDFTYSSNRQLLSFINDEYFKVYRFRYKTNTPSNGIEVNDARMYGRWEA